MTRRNLTLFLCLTCLSVSFLVACGEPTEESPEGPSSAAEASASQAPAPAAPSKPPELLEDLPATCALLPPDQLQELTGLEAKRWKRDQADNANPLLDSCAWRLDGDKPIILTLTVRANKSAKKRPDWSDDILQPLLTDGRTDKQGKNYPYEAVSGVGTRAAWSAADAQLRWSADNRYLLTLHTQKPGLLSKTQFLALAEAVNAKIYR